MSATPKFGFRYPAGSDAGPDVPLWMSRLALDLETEQLASFQATPRLLYRNNQLIVPATGGAVDVVEGIALPTTNQSVAFGLIDSKPAYLGVEVVPGLTAKLRLNMTVAINSVAPARNFTAKLIQVSLSGSNGWSIAKTGELITGPSVNVPAAASITSVESPRLTIDPAWTGAISPAVTLSGALATNSVATVSLSLWKVYE